MSKHEQLYENLKPTRLFAVCALPNMISMAVTALYTVADGIFVGVFVGANALAAINLVMPLIMMSFALSDMIAVGSSVQIAIRLGMKKEEDASRIFTVCSLLIVGISCAVGVVGFFLSDFLLRLMGADAVVTALASEYLKVYAIFSPAIMIFFAVDNYLRICGRVRYSMGLNVAISLLNILLDFLFVGVWRLGVGSAALASCLSLSVGTLLGFLPFFGGALPLRFARGGVALSLLGNIIANGASEFFSNIAGSVLMVVLNSVLLRLSGSMAVAAFSIVLYVDSVVNSLLYGLADSMQPAISYCHGARLGQRMLALEKRVLAASAIISALAMALMLCGGERIVSLFIPGGDRELLAMSLRAMELFSLSYLSSWVGISLSAFFTAMNRPGLSLSLAICRSLCFPLLCLAVLPGLWGVDGVWLTSPIGGALTAVMAAVLTYKILRRDKLWTFIY